MSVIFNHYPVAKAFLDKQKIIKYSHPFCGRCDFGGYIWPLPGASDRQELGANRARSFASFQSRASREAKPRPPPTDVTTLILNAVNLKRAKGDAYAAGKTLVVFLNAAAGPWHANDVARQLPDPLCFKAVWVVGLDRVEADE